MRFRWVTCLSMLFATFLLSGCGPEVSREELGEVMFKMPTLPPPEPAAREQVPPTAASPQTETTEPQE